MLKTCFTLQWLHNDRDGVPNLDVLLNHVLRRGSKKILKVRVTGLCEGNSPVTGEFPPQRPVTRKVFPFNDVIMNKEKWSLAGIETGPLNGFKKVEIALYFYRAHLSQRIRKKSNKCKLLGYVNNKQRILSKKVVCSLKIKTSYSVETAYHPPLYEHSPHS